MDCERMKYPFTGLYHFCYELGSALQKQIQNNSEQLSFYVRKNDKGIFGDDTNYVLQNSFQKFLMPRFKGKNIWHCTYQNSNYFPYYTKAKIVLTIHDLNFLHEGVADDKRRKIISDLQKKIDRADYIVAISEFTLNDIRNNLDIRNKKTTVIYNGCNLPSLQNPELPAFVPSMPFIYSIGTIHPKKNFHVLVPLLQNNSYQLIISGVKDREDYWNKIKNVAEEHDVASRVILTGPVSENEKVWYLKNCRAFAFPSLAEGFGLPVIEAMQFGKPVFLSNKTSLPEVGGEHAFYFNDFDPEHMQETFHHGLNKYDEEPWLADLIKTQAIKFSWEKTAAQYLQIYRELSD